MSFDPLRRLRQTNWLRGSGLRIAFIFSVATVVLLLVVNIVISQRGSQLFWTLVPASGHNAQDLRYYTTLPAGAPAPPAGFGANFVQKFQATLVWVTVAAAATALLLGLALGYIFITRPLRQLQRAIGRLKQRNFQTTTPTGLPEFDQVVADFNGLAAELKRAEELRKDLISDTSHELKTPIHSLTMQVQAMIDGLVPPSRVELEQMLVQINRLDDLSEQLQEYARIRSQLVRPRPTRFELLSLVQTVAKDYAADITRAGVQVVFDIPAGHIIQADHALLGRLLGNLFRNTIIHAQARHITISAHEHQLVFSDDGRGVESRHLDHLFERFYQAKSRDQPGLGLGLSIVSDIAEAHGWRVHASSRAGHGFIITLEL